MTVSSLLTEIRVTRNASWSPSNWSWGASRTSKDLVHVVSSLPMCTAILSKQETSSRTISPVNDRWWIFLLMLTCVGIMIIGGMVIMCARRCSRRPFQRDRRPLDWMGPHPWTLGNYPHDAPVLFYCEDDDVNDYNEEDVMISNEREMAHSYRHEPQDVLQSRSPARRVKRSKDGERVGSSRLHRPVRKKKAEEKTREEKDKILQPTVTSPAGGDKGDVKSANMGLSLTCTLCFTGELEGICVPCGHAVACKECQQRLQTEARNSHRHVQCPHCRKVVRRFNKVYWPT